MSELLTLDSQGNPPVSRIATPQVFAARAKLFWDADSDGRFKRYRYNRLLSNAPPLTQRQIEEYGLKDYPNFSSGRAAHKLFMANAAMYDITNSVDFIGYWEVDPYKYPNDFREYSLIISEEVQKIFDREWEDFEYQKQMLFNCIIKDGVGVAYFDDEDDWRWRASGLDKVCFPRDTNAWGTPIEECYWRRNLPVDVLFGYIANWNCGNGTIDLGWNVEAVIQAINRATSREEEGSLMTDYEYYLRKFKNNDFFAEGRVTQTVKCWVGLIKEFDGSVSFAIQAEGDSSRYLYCSKSCYKQMDDAIIVFTRNIGVDGTLYGVIGLGETIFPEETAYDRAINDMLATAQFTSRLIVPIDETDKGNAKVSVRGSFCLVDPSFKAALNASQLPNPATILAPIQDILDRNLDTKAGAYSAARVGNQMGKTPPSATQIEYDAMQMNTLSSASLNLFYKCLERLLNAQRRRMQNRTLTTLDSKPAECIKKLLVNLLKRGVPAEAFYSVEYVKVVKAIGAGSPSARRVILEQLMNVRGELSPQAGRDLTRLWIGSWAGFDLAEKLLPRNEATPLPTNAEKQAVMENSLMKGGIDAQVFGDENHEVHIQIHLEDGMQALTAIQEQQLDPQTGVNYMAKLLQHTEQHLLLFYPSMGKEQKKAEFMQIFQNLTQFTVNAGRQLQKMQEDELRALQEQQPQQSADPEKQEKIEFLKAQNLARIELLKQQIQKNALLNAALQQKIEANTIKTQQYIERAKLNQEIKLLNQQMKIRDYKLKELKEIEDANTLRKAKS